MDTMLHTLLWIFILIAFTKVGLKGIGLDPDTEVFSAIRIHHLRIEAYTNENKMRGIHANLKAPPPSRNNTSSRQIEIILSGYHLKQPKQN